VITDRWREIDELLEAAMEHEPGERAAFLDKACAGNDSLRREVESLLAAHEQAGSFIEKQPAVAARIFVQDDARLIGSTLGHFEIRALLGRGGMGEVYRAKDIKLGRDVALKILPEHSSRNRDSLRRFAREAVVLARLNDPHICTVHEIGHHQGRPFIAMELVEGEALSEHIKQGRFTADKLLGIALQITDALSRAHSEGIVHRDIKSGNIFIKHDGQVKILDFGLAKLLPKAEALQTAVPVTMTSSGAGLLLGTPAYMSPEQALGRSVDARSDLFSLGVVFYEMASGELPFTASTVVGVLDNILNREPIALANLNPSLPPGLESIIGKALRKDADLRYQAATEMLADLLELQRKLQSGIKGRAVAPRLKARHSSIAVMPFVDTSPKRQDEYFGDGLAEEIISALSRVPNLRVVSRTSAFNFKGKNVDVRVIGEKLNVSAVLEGTIRRFRARLRVSVRLVDSVDGYQIWAETYDRRARDIFAVQDEIAQQIVAELKMQSQNASQEPLVQPRTNSIDAYNLYLRGRFHFSQRTPQGLKKSIGCFKAALDKDSGYSLAYAGMADANTLLGDYTKAKLAALKALRTDEESAEAHSSLGLIRMYHDHDWKSSEREFKRALELSPAYATAHHWYAMLLEHAGRFGEAIIEIKRALDLEPFSLIIGAAVARIHLHAGDVNEALKYALKTIELDPNFHAGHLVLGWIYRKKGMFREAYSALEKAYQLSDGDWKTFADLVSVDAAAGRLSKARAGLGKLQQAYRKKAVSAYFIAAVYTALGEQDGAFEWLNRAFKEKSTSVIDLYVDTRFDDLRSDPRFARLLRRIHPK
jgi:serine/threonine protein kinase/tetratricopeptide (TPR) repeat protein